MSVLSDGLSRALERAGQDVILRRKAGAPPNRVNIDVVCRAVVRSPTADELVANFKQTDSKVIISPNEIVAAQWPGGQPADSIHPEVPRDGDWLVIEGRDRRIESVNPITVNGELVRIEMRVLGSP